MPGREVPLVNDNFYHVINRGISSLTVFSNQEDYSRAWETLFYYQNIEVPVKYSSFLKLPSPERSQILKDMASKRQLLVEVLVFCFMPNHVHLILKQTNSGGISTFMSNFSNSYTRYFNTKQDRVGPLFQGKFKAFKIWGEEQLIHLSRYIHLNPLTSEIVNNFEELKNYPYSSLQEYISHKVPTYCSRDLILDIFKNQRTYERFVFDNAGYQKSLQQIKLLSGEK